MQHLESPRAEMAGPLHALSSEPAPRPLANGRECYDLGVMYAAGREVALDRVAAHKWLNIAAALGCRDAAPLRAELAEEMSPAEIATAQREARLWLSLH